MIKLIETKLNNRVRKYDYSCYIWPPAMLWLAHHHLLYCLVLTSCPLMCGLVLASTQGERGCLARDCLYQGTTKVEVGFKRYLQVNIVNIEKISKHLIYTLKINLLNICGNLPRTKLDTICKSETNRGPKSYNHIMIFISIIMC